MVTQMLSAGGGDMPQMAKRFQTLGQNDATTTYIGIHISEITSQPAVLNDFTATGIILICNITIEF